MPTRKRLNHRGPLSIDVTSAWYFITICAAERVQYGRVGVPSPTVEAEHAPLGKVGVPSPTAAAERAQGRVGIPSPTAAGEDVVGADGDGTPSLPNFGGKT